LFLTEKRQDGCAEIFVNIRLYPGTRTFPVKLACAVARKVIVLDFDKVSFEYVFGIGAVVLAMGIVYRLVAAKTEP